MEMQLQELIEQIKKDGVIAAEAEAEKILNSAKAEADKMLEDAKKKSDKIIADANKEREHLVSVGEEALKQAARNVLISFRESIARELGAIISANVSDVYSEDSLTEIITNAITAWTKKPDTESITILLSEKDAAALEASLLASLKSKLSAGITIKPSNTFDGGFRISSNGSGAYYDYSAEAVTDMLSAYLVPRVSALLKEAEKI